MSLFADISTKYIFFGHLIDFCCTVLLGCRSAAVQRFTALLCSEVYRRSQSTTYVSLPYVRMKTSLLFYSEQELYHNSFSVVTINH
jgi:hypothetical protein